MFSDYFNWLLLTLLFICDYWNGKNIICSEIDFLERVLLDLLEFRGLLKQSLPEYDITASKPIPFFLAALRESEGKNRLVKWMWAFTFARVGALHLTDGFTETRNGRAESVSLARTSSDLKTSATRHAACRPCRPGWPLPFPCFISRTQISQKSNSRLFFLFQRG